MSAPSRSCANAAGSRMPSSVAARLDAGVPPFDSLALPDGHEESAAAPLRIASNTLAQLGALFRQLVIGLDMRDLSAVDRHRLKQLAALGAHVAEDAANLADCPREVHTSMATARGQR